MSSSIGARSPNRTLLSSSANPAAGADGGKQADPATGSPRNALPSLASMLRWRIVAGPLCVCLLGVAALALTYWRVYDANSSLRSDWSAVKSMTSAWLSTSSSATRTLSDASVLTAMQTLANATLLQLLSSAGSAASAESYMDTSFVRQVCRSSDVVASLRSADNVLLQASAQAASRLLRSLGPTTSFTPSPLSWCAAFSTSAPISGTNINTLCVVASAVGVAIADTPFSVTAAILDAATLQSTSAVTYSFTSVSGSATGVATTPLITSQLLASAAAQLKGSYGSGSLPLTSWALDSATLRIWRNATFVESASGLTVAVQRATSTLLLSSRMATVVSAAMSTFCDSRRLGACASLVTVADLGSATSLVTFRDASTRDGQSVAFPSATLSQPATAAYMTSPTASLPPTTQSTTAVVGISRPCFMAGRRSTLLANLQVAVSFDADEPMLATAAYAASALDVIDNSLLAAHICFAVGACLVLLLIPVLLSHAGRVATSIAAPIERLTEDFTAAAQMKLTSITIYRREDPTGTAPALPAAAMDVPQVRLDSAESRLTTASGIGVPAVNRVPGAPRAFGGGSHSPSPPSAPMVQFSTFSSIANLQMRCNQMVTTLNHCAAFLPRSIWRLGNGAQPPETPLPDVAQIFPPVRDQVSSAEPPPRLQIMVSDADEPSPPPAQSTFSPRLGTSVASPMNNTAGTGSDASPHPNLDTFRFGSNADVLLDGSPQGVTSPAVEDLETSANQLTPSAMDFGLRRTTASLVHASFAGFLKMVQDMSLHEAHCVSQIFLSVVVGIIERHGGVVLTVTADRVTATWAAFSHVAHHENRAAACGFDIRRALEEAEREQYLPELMWCVVVATGNVVVGTSGTETDRSPTIHGPCVEVASELPALLVAIGVQVAVTEAVRAKLSSARDRDTPWHTIPIDRVTLSHGAFDITVHELRTGPAPEYGPLYDRAFEAFMNDDWKLARQLFQEVLQASAKEVVLQDADEPPILMHDPQAERMHRLCALFESLGVSYIRALPAWQRFEFDVLEADAVDSHSSRPRERRTLAEKRKSVMPDDILRTELINLHNMRTAKQASPKASQRMEPSSLSPPFAPPANRRSSLAAPGNASRRGSTANGAVRRVSLVVPDHPPMPTDDSASSPKVQPMAASLLLGGSGSPSSPSHAKNRRPSRRPFTEAASFSLSIAAATPPTANLEPTVSPPQPDVLNTSVSGSSLTTPLRPGVFEFRDRKQMLFRVSNHVLGRGAAGEVLLGISETGCLVAVKTVLIPRQTVASDNLTPIQRRRLKRKGINVSGDVMTDVENLLQEVSVLSRLRDDHIVGYLSSAIVANGTKLAVVMEYISGGSLLGLLKEFDGMPLKTVKRYLRDILAGLKFLHSEGIIHRDLKPHNALLLIDGRCKLTDFGTSSSIDKIAGATDTVGTPQYMSPEACRGEALTTASDMWSFGVLMAQLLTGELPWDMEHFVPIAFVYQVGHSEDKVPRIRNAESIPEAAMEIMSKCFERDPTKRPTAEQLLAHPFFQAATTPMRSSGRASSRAGSRGRRSVQGSDAGGVTGYANSSRAASTKRGAPSPSDRGSASQLAFDETPSAMATSPDIVVIGHSDDDEAGAAADHDLGEVEEQQDIHYDDSQGAQDDNADTHDAVDVTNDETHETHDAEGFASGGEEGEVLEIGGHDDDDDEAEEEFEIHDPNSVQQHGEEEEAEGH